jgi:hypothetical protein
MNRGFHLPLSRLHGRDARATKTVRSAIAVVAVLLFVSISHAATPELQIVLPRGAQRGTEADLVLRGQRLGDAQEILFYDPSIAVTKLDATNPGELKAHVKIASDAKLGEHQLRVRTATGISELRTFYVVPFPIVVSKKPNNDFRAPQPVDLNVTVAGTIEDEEVDYFVVQAKKGQRITAEVQGMRLGGAPFDPYVAILDSKRFELAASDDTALALQDPIASVLAPADGPYVIQIRETSYGGNGDCRYLLHIGTFPRPMAVYPLGVKAGEDRALQFIGDVAGPIPQTIHLPAAQNDHMEIFAQEDGLSAPSANFVRASLFPNVLEVEPNNDPKTATVAKIPLPLAFNGVISEPNDIDFFRFTAKKDQAIDVRVIARQLRSPLDSVLRIYNADGGQIADNDDAGGPDSYLRFNPPGDGDYLLSITDQLHQGGIDYTYRVELTPVVPQLLVTIPSVQQNSQERQAIPVPRGHRFATLLRATRFDFGGDVAIASGDLPPGITLSSDNIPANGDTVPVLFEAAPDAPTGGKLCTLNARCTDPNQHVEGHFDQNVELVNGPNNVPFYTSRTDKLAVAVTNPVPFKLRIEQPKVPLVQNGQMNLRVIAERAPDFHGPIALHMLFNPPGVSSSPQVDMPGDKSEVLYPLSANDGAETRKWKICIMGQADLNGPVWASSQLADLEVAPSFVAMRLEMTAIERGKPTPILCNVDQRTKFDGTATVKLLGLPPETTAADLPLTSADQRLVFNINTTDKSPIGSHSSLFCEVTFMQNGEPITQQAGQGGVLRIDPPPPPKKDQPVVVAAPKVAAAPAAPPTKVLSRLEKLRLEQEQK